MVSERGASSLDVVKRLGFRVEEFRAHGSVFGFGSRLLLGALRVLGLGFYGSGSRI